MVKKLVYVFALIFVLGDLSYSFFQYLGQRVDGDVAINVVPDKDVEPVLESPLGFKALLDDEKYVNPNRFFSHWLQHTYQSKVPLILQTVTDPVSSIYLSSSILKSITQITLLFLICYMITGSRNIFSFDFVITAALIIPFFQANGYRSYMGIVDPSITYTFFYAVPLIFVIVYFLPFFKTVNGRTVNLSPTQSMILLVPLSVISSLSGALNPGISLVIALLFTIYFLTKHFKEQSSPLSYQSVLSTMGSIDRKLWIYIIPIGILSLYSLYLGQYNSMAIDDVPTFELYRRLPQGIFNQFTSKLGFPILILAIIINIILLKKNKKDQSAKRILIASKWILFFILAYILLLPLGGFRSYRSNVLRYDTILPVTVSLIFLYGLSSFYLVHHFSGKVKWIYSFGLVVILSVFTFADDPGFENNICEKKYLQDISNTEIETLPTSYDCRVLHWRNEITPYEAELNTRLLRLWNVVE